MTRFSVKMLAAASLAATFGAAIVGCSHQAATPPPPPPAPLSAYGPGYQAVQDAKAKGMAADRMHGAAAPQQH